MSPDRRVVGDAKYFSLVGGIGLPAAKFSIIAEHVRRRSGPGPAACAAPMWRGT